jgi:uncharacterized protein YjbI with pentapeptide repeats
MHTTFNDVTFNDCKLIGILFQNCNDFLLAFSFTNCTLNLCSFYQLKMNTTQFKNCKVHHVDLTEAKAKKATFLDCDLKGSIFERTNLEYADFSTAYNFSINPSNNQIKNAIFSKENCFGLLSAFHIIIK